MNSERIYKATIENENNETIEKLVYEVKSASGIKYRDMEEAYFYFRYINLFRICEIENLVPLSRMLNLKKNMTREAVLKRYHEDLHRLLHVTDLYIGNIGFDINERIQPLLYNRLLQKVGETFLDLEDYLRYYDSRVILEEPFVYEKSPFAKVFQGEIGSAEMPKQKVLEMYYKKFRE